MLTYAQKYARLQELRAREARLTGEFQEFRDRHPGGITSLPANLRTRAEDMATARQKVDDEIKAVEEELRGDLAAMAGNGHVDTPAAQTRSTADTSPVSRVRSLAMRTVEASVRSGLLPDYAAERVERLVSSGREADQTAAARWVNASGSDAYTRAFAKLAADPTRGHMNWTPEESAAWRAATEVRAALNLSNGAGMVPLVLDPAIMLTNSGSNNPLRAVSRVVQTVSDSWNGVTSAGATAEWKAEGVQAADGTPGLTPESIPVFMGDVDVLYSYEIGMDAVNFTQELQRVARDAGDNLMAAAYTTGNGSTAPKGIITALAGTSSEINSTGAEGVLDKANPFQLQDVLPARFSANARFMSHIAIANGYRQMETSNGALQFPELRENPPMLLGKAWLENSNMDGAISATNATANNYVMVYGDFGQFVIVDRIGATFEILPDYGANGRPTGQRHLFMTFRTGSDAVVPEAFRLLDVPTTA